jgi:hypothetical protein
MRLLAVLVAAAAQSPPAWVPLPPPISCGAVLKPNNTFCIYMRNNCSDVASLKLGLVSIPGNTWAVPPAQTWSTDTWFSFPSLFVGPGFADYSVNVFYNATLTDGRTHTFGLGCIFGPTEFDCSFDPGKKPFNAQPFEQLDAPSFVGFLMYDKKK